VRRVPRRRRQQHRAGEPEIAGQFPEYLNKQLGDFKPKDGKKPARESPVMMGMVANLSEADMKSLAATMPPSSSSPRPPPIRTWSPWDRRSGAAVIRRRTYRHAPVATARQVPAFRRSTPGSPGSTPSIWGPAEGVSRGYARQ